MNLKESYSFLYSDLVLYILELQASFKTHSHAILESHPESRTLFLTSNSDQACVFQSLVSAA